LKTILFPLVFVILRWYWKRIKSLPRNAVLVEKAIAVLGVSLLILDCKFLILNNWNGYLGILFRGRLKIIII